MRMFRTGKRKTRYAPHARVAYRRHNEELAAELAAMAIELGVRPWALRRYRQLGRGGQKICLHLYNDMEK